MNLAVNHLISKLIKAFIVWGILFGVFSISCISQSTGTLHLNGDELSGSCENRVFTGFKIELDSIYGSIDSTTLFAQLPRMGTINFRNRIDIPTEFTVTKRSGKPQIMFRFRTSYYTFDDLVIRDDSILFLLDIDPEVPATSNDLKIIHLAKKLLATEEQWHQEDDRVCTDDLGNGSYSLYCAVRLASLEVEEMYNHRNAVLQKVRHLIDKRYPSRKWDHRFVEYNNMKETSYADILGILNEIETDFKLQLGVDE